MKRYQVFLSSTKLDLELERHAVWQELTNLNYIVVGMETFPATAEEQMSYIKRRIDLSDYFILVIGGRYGTVSTGGLSFTEMEFDYATAAGIPILVFPVKDIGSRPASGVDSDGDLRERLRRFHDKATTGRTCKFWQNASDLASSVGHALRYAEQTAPRPGWERSGDQSNSELLQKNAELRDEVDKLARAQKSSLNAAEIDLLRKDLEKQRDCSYENLESGSVVNQTISISEVLQCVNVDGYISRDSLEHGLAYALSEEAENKSDKLTFDNISVFSGMIDETILVLHQYRALIMTYDNSRVVISPGPNWLVAHRLARGLE